MPPALRVAKPLTQNTLKAGCTLPLVPRVKLQRLFDAHCTFIPNSPRWPVLMHDFLVCLLFSYFFQQLSALVLKDIFAHGLAKGYGIVPVGVFGPVDYLFAI